MSGARAAKTTDKEFEKGRVDQTKVQRYWPGRAPVWEDRGGDDDIAAAAPKERTRTEISAPVIVKKAVDDPRLLRLARIVDDRDQDEDREESLARRRHARHEEEEEGGDEEENDSEEESASEEEEQEDEEETLKRRQAVRDRLLKQRQAEEELAQAQGQEEEDEEEEGSSEYETDSEDDDDGPGFGRRLLKPVLVPKRLEETIAERDALEEEEEQLAVNEKARLAERKVETQQLVRERVAQEEAERHGGHPDTNEHAESVDTDVVAWVWPLHISMAIIGGFFLSNLMVAVLYIQFSKGSKGKGKQTAILPSEHGSSIFSSGSYGRASASGHGFFGSVEPDIDSMNAYPSLEERLTGVCVV
eukprot:gene13778-19686_t